MMGFHGEVPTEENDEITEDDFVISIFHGVLPHRLWYETLSSETGFNGQLGHRYTSVS